MVAVVAEMLMERKFCYTFDNLWYTTYLVTVLLLLLLNAYLAHFEPQLLALVF
jgi:hypothetical protein